MLVHTVGAGAVGGLVAHAAGRAGAEVLLILRTPAAEANLAANDRQLVVSAGAARSTVRTVPSRGHISTLIVATKAHQTVAALQPLLPRLLPLLAVLFVQNGVGVADDVGALWTPSSSPRLYQGVISHGALRASDYAFHILHTGSGTLSVGPMFPGQLPVPGVVELLMQPPNSLATSYTLYERLKVAQLEKLVVNCCIGPLTTLWDCPNGLLVQNRGAAAVMRRLAAECRRVLFAEYPFLTASPAHITRFATLRLVEQALAVARRTASNSSSMREDVRHMREPELAYTNGYVVRLGKKHLIPTTANATMVALVEGMADQRVAAELAAIRRAT